MNHFFYKKKKTISFGYFRQGARGRELLSTVGKSVVSAGGTFGTFMAIGSAIRC